MDRRLIVLVRGGGDLASGVALRLFRAGIQVVITELPEPLAIRRLVSFAEAAYSGEITIEGVKGIRVDSPEDAARIIDTILNGRIPVVIDPTGKTILHLHPGVIVDARMLKQGVPFENETNSFNIGLGPGFQAGENCHVIVETQRGHSLGRIYWEGSGLMDTGVPDPVLGISGQRLLRSPASGRFLGLASLGNRLEAGQPVAEVNGEILLAPFDGILRGLLHSGLVISKGFKVGDIDPRNDPRLCTLVSDKALAVGGGVMEAILSQPGLRKILWE